MTTDWFTRQAALVPREQARQLTVTVIGVGAIGRQAALQLASLGVGRLQLVDFDRVEATNVTTQGYRASDVGRLKVDATAAAVEEIDPSIVVCEAAERFRPRLEVGEAVFCCVDTISARAAIWKALEGRVRFWADGRMRGEVIRVLAATDEAGRAAYGRSLFKRRPGRAGRRASSMGRRLRRGSSSISFRGGCAGRRWRGT